MSVQRPARAMYRHYGFGGAALSSFVRDANKAVEVWLQVRVDGGESDVWLDGDDSADDEMMPRMMR